jgi:hypothetical protein
MDDPNILGQPENKKKRGRPPKPVEKDFDSLSEPEKILHTYSEGRFDSAVCRVIEISKEEFDERCKEDAGFKRLISFGRTLCRAWWEDRYQAAAAGEKIASAAMVNLAMKNMFGWAEKSETENKDLLNIEGLSREETMQKIRDLGPNILELVKGKAA